MTVAVDAKAEAPAPPVGAIPRNYNFAADILDRNLKAGRADKPAFIDPRGTWTYGQLADRVARFAASLRALGVRREERVLIALLDTIDWPTAFLGCLKAGVVAVPVNTLMTEDDYRFMLADSRARMLVVSDALYPRFQKLIGAASDLEHVIVSGEAVRGHKVFEDLIESAMAEAHTAPTVRDDIAFWLYTSGSTGKPKGAVHVHADLKLTDDLYGGPFLEITENDVCYSVAKLFFAYGLGNALTFPMSAGACTVLLPDRPTPDGVAALSFASIRSRCSTRCRPSTPRSWPAPPRRSAPKSNSAAACPRARRCPRTSASAGSIATASTSSTASARPRCCTSSSPTARAR